MFQKSQNAPGDHEIVERRVETEHKKREEKKALDVAADFPGIQMQAWKTAEFEQGEQVAQHEQPDKNGKGKKVRLKISAFEQINAQKGEYIRA